MSSFARAEADWLRPPEKDYGAVYDCCLCGETICTGEEYLETCAGMVCSCCLDGLTAREFACALLGSTTTIAYTD
ncbi:hypothetical protein [uncultured Phascolarctobacterium sp.]|uniref:hypothetical protein n=1 Tax=uncultured Phascolarctobacterium sp. TaxID=512296 RepID=UPI0025F88D1C|nr:hypothetical protein [uncultured Phascolarctobacterium sp.]